MPVATIKFYVREQLLPGGEKTSATQTNYGEPQLARLRLIRALVEVGGLSIANVRTVLAAIDDESRPVADAISAAACALPMTGRESADDIVTPGETAIDDLIAARGWMVLPGSAGRALAARVIDDYLELGRPDLTVHLDVYADAVERIAEAAAALDVRRTFLFARRMQSDGHRYFVAPALPGSCCIRRICTLSMPSTASPVSRILGRLPIASRNFPSGRKRWR